MNQFLVIHGATAMSLFEKDASSSALRVFMTLCLYANVNDGTCFPSIGTICSDAKIAERTARDALDWLVYNGFIGREKCFDDSGRQTSNTYSVFNKGAVDRSGEGAVDRIHPGAVGCTPGKSTNKERESDIKKPLYPLEKGKQLDLSSHPSLESHREAIEDWLAYKMERGQTYKPRGFKGLLTELSKMSDPSSAIRKSISCNYAGVFENGSAKAQTKPKTAQEKLDALRREMGYDENDPL